MVRDFETVDANRIQVVSLAADTMQHLQDRKMYRKARLISRGNVQPSKTRRKIHGERRLEFGGKNIVRHKHWD